MSDYTARDAAGARTLYLMDQGHSRDAIDVWPIGGWADDGPGRFVYNGEGDEGEEQVLCTVEFDDHGNATVSFPDGESGTVNIGAKTTD
jgi:hypothetical protein